MLEKCVPTILELNWNQRFGPEKTKLNLCHHMLTSFTQLKNRSFHVVERTGTSACKNTVFHCQICKFVGFLLPSSSWLLKLPNNIAEHHLQTNHRIDWDSVTCVTYSTYYYQRIVLESWFTNLEQTPINRCLQLLAPYKRLIDDINSQTTQ